MTIKAATEGRVQHNEVGHDYLTGVIVQPKGKGCGVGRWYCMTHGQTFANNMMKDWHCDEATVHVLAWDCFIHNCLEVP